MACSTAVRTDTRTAMMGNPAILIRTPRVRDDAMAIPRGQKPWRPAPHAFPPIGRSGILNACRCSHLDLNGHAFVVSDRQKLCLFEMIAPFSHPSQLGVQASAVLPTTDTI